MRPRPWSSSVALSAAEAVLVGRLKTKSRFFVCLREIRHDLLSTKLQADLAALYEDRPRGRPPCAPERLALATLLQAYTGLSDADVVEALVADRRWQLVLDCWDAERPPFTQATLVHFRKRLIAADGDRRLVERVLELAEATGGFGRHHLRLALDSSPLWGAGRVEGTVNLLGTALRRAVTALAKHHGQALETLAQTLGTPEVLGASLKGQLDLEWTDAHSRDQALATVLAVLERVEAQVEALPKPVADYLAAARQVQAQDVVVGTTGQPTLREGVARDRRISIADAAMRHGRKSKAVRFDGYKRHAVRDLGQAGLVRAVAVTPEVAPVWWTPASLGIMDLKDTERSQHAARDDPPGICAGVPR